MGKNVIFTTKTAAQCVVPEFNPCLLRHELVPHRIDIDFRPDDFPTYLWSPVGKKTGPPFALVCVLAVLGQVLAIFGGVKIVFIDMKNQDVLRNAGRRDVFLGIGHDGGFAVGDGLSVNALKSQWKGYLETRTAARLDPAALTAVAPMATTGKTRIAIKEKEFENGEALANFDVSITLQP